MHRALAALIAAVAVAALIAPSPAHPEGERNLKVLPADISRDDLKAQMKQISKDLGVKCSFCHVKDDFASDDNKHKRIARKMMKMTQDINGRHFAWEGAPQVSCFTCHQGQKEPAERE